MDNTQGVDFDRVREKVWGLPGFVPAISTIPSKGDTWLPQAEYIVETIRYQEEGKSQYLLFLRWIGGQGSGRIVLPAKVMEAIYRQREQVISKGRKNTARRVHETLKAKAVNQSGEAIKDDQTGNK